MSVRSPLPTLLAVLSLAGLGTPVQAAKETYTFVVKIKADYGDVDDPTSYQDWRMRALSMPVGWTLTGKNPNKQGLGTAIMSNPLLPNEKLDRAMGSVLTPRGTWTFTFSGPSEAEGAKACHFLMQDGRLGLRYFTFTCADHQLTMDKGQDKVNGKRVVLIDDNPPILSILAGYY